MAVFVSSGTGRDESSARADSYMNVLEQLGSQLGYDAVSPYYRELLSTNAIASLSARITNTYSAPASEGVIYFAMFEMPENIYYSSRDAEYSASLERTDEIENLLDSALEHYRNNEDTEALLASLQALDLSLSGAVLNEDFSPDILLGKAMDYLRNIEIRIQEEVDGTDVSVRMKRTKGFLHPDVINGLVRVEYPMLDGDGNVMMSSVVIRTEGKGIARFFRTNPYMLRKGTLRFSVYIPEDLVASIERKAFEGFLNPFHDLLELLSLDYDYTDRSAFSEDNTMICITDYDEAGVERKTTPSFESFSSYLESAAADEYLVVPGNGEEELDVLQYARRASPGFRNYIIVRSGIVDRAEGAGRVYSMAESMVSFYNADSNEPHTVRMLSVTGGGDNVAEADTAALNRCGKAAAGMFLSEF